MAEEPAAKKAKTEEQETDAVADDSPKITESPAFHAQNTTLNVMQCDHSDLLMPLTDGGLQYLLAGARANVGVKSGRYAFEVKIVEVITPTEDNAVRAKTPKPGSSLRVGFAVAGSSLFLGDSKDSICFDAEGSLLHNATSTKAGAAFNPDQVVAVVLNLDQGSVNANTVSLFVDGERAGAPQPLPEVFFGKTLFPALTFRNVTVRCNFGELSAPLPFTCRTLEEAAQRDVTIEAAPKPTSKDGKYEALFPICLPDEGGFDWLDLFLEENPQFTELSDRSILRWAEKSGINRPRGYKAFTSNDKPEPGFGIPAMDDGSISRVLQQVARLQERSFVVMEVKANLVKEEREKLLAKWATTGHKTTARVMIGSPPASFIQRNQELMLKQKQEASDAEFRTKQEAAKKNKALAARQKKMEKERKKKQEQLKKQAAVARKKMEIERKKKEAAAKGEEFVEEEVEEEPEKEEEEEDEAEEEDAMDEEPPTVELTSEEKKEAFRKSAVPDLAEYAMNTSFTKFTLPDKDEGFDAISYDWQNAEGCSKYLKQWVQDKKGKTRIEDLKPGEWFVGRWADWQKALKSWHVKHTAYKTALLKKASEKRAREMKRAAAAAAKEARAKAAQAAAEKKAREKEAKAAAKAAARAEAKAAAEAEGTEPPAEEEEEEEQEEDVPMPEPAEEEVEEKEPEEIKVDFDGLDIFGLEDILDVGGGMPLFNNFSHEDWAMMSLRAELHLLAHAFRRDVNDEDRQAIHLEHLAFYYPKYFKKPLNLKLLGVENISELLPHIRDTVMVRRAGQVMLPQLPDDMESFDVFVMLSEEGRRERVRRIDLGEASMKLKMVQPATSAVAASMGAPPITSTPVQARPGNGAAPGAVRPVAAQGGARPMVAPGAGGGLRPAVRPAITPASGPRPVITPGGGIRPAITPAARPAMTPGGARPMITPGGARPMIRPNIRPMFFG